MTTEPSSTDPTPKNVPDGPDLNSLLGDHHADFNKDLSGGGVTEDDHLLDESSKGEDDDDSESVKSQTPVQLQITVPVLGNGSTDPSTHESSIEKVSYLLPNFVFICLSL